MDVPRPLSFTAGENMWKQLILITCMVFCGCQSTHQDVPQEAQDQAHVDAQDAPGSTISCQACQERLWIKNHCWRDTVDRVNNHYRVTCVFDTPKNPLGSLTVMVEADTYLDALKAARAAVTDKK